MSSGRSRCTQSSGRSESRCASAGTATEEVQAFLLVANFGARPRDLYVTMREENASDVLASRSYEMTSRRTGPSHLPGP